METRGFDGNQEFSWKLGVFMETRSSKANSQVRDILSNQGFTRQILLPNQRYYKLPVGQAPSFDET